MATGDHLTRVIDDRIRLLLKQWDKSRTTVVSGGGYSVAPSVGGVAQHALYGSAHTEQPHHTYHEPGGSDEIDVDAEDVDYDPTVSGLSATDVKAAIDELAATGGFSLTVEEQDAAPSVSDVTTIRVTNGSLTDEGSGVVSIDTGSSGGGAGALGIYGDASDGDADLDGSNTVAWASLVGSTYTMTRDAWLHNLTVESTKTLLTDGCRIYCTGTLTNLGTIHNNGNNASNATAGGATSVSHAAGNGAAGGNGANATSANGSNGVNPGVNSWLGGTSGKGGDAGAGGRTGGTAVTASPLAAQFYPRTLPGASTGLIGGIALSVQWVRGGPGGGGGANNTAVAGNFGGGGGGGGGVIIIAAKTLDNTGATISAHGGDGANGAGASGGGGGGGGGGAILLVYETLVDVGTLNVAGGNQGSGAGTGSAGDAGNTGHTIQVQN